jgi:hypothetical protein
MIRNYYWLFGEDQAQKRQVITQKDRQKNLVVEECYCPQGHSIISERAIFGGHRGLTLRLRSADQDGLLSISPIIGDRDRTFISFTGVVGEVVEICCPVCAEPFPVYNECSCGAHLVAMFTSSQTTFAQCIGICQRLGCLHSELLTERDLHLFSRREAL